jgi:hypothetical protein
MSLDFQKLFNQVVKIVNIFLFIIQLVISDFFFDNVFYILQRLQRVGSKKDFGGCDQVKFVGLVFLKHFIQVFFVLLWVVVFLLAHFFLVKLGCVRVGLLFRGYFILLHG